MVAGLGFSFTLSNLTYWIPRNEVLPPIQRPYTKTVKVTKTDAAVQAKADSVDALTNVIPAGGGSWRWLLGLVILLRRTRR